ncbi:30S ribosomal protein S19e [Candidatus Pacearchaeota archaeon]|nr:MAG: 30S ribosomal protein S19e [Candidatus Pacearchaeota archaeon]
MVDVRAVEAGKFNIALARVLKEEKLFEKPEWVELVKTSVHKKRPSIEEDFWFKRAASILRQIYIRGVVGVQRLRTRYGGRKDRGMKPPEFRKGGGKIIRVILQQAESSGLVEKVKGKRSGRTLTEKGRELLESVASKLGGKNA